MLLQSASLFFRRNAFYLLLCSVVVLTGCATALWDNSTTYFNTYYNAKRLLRDTEEEFGYQDEVKKPPKPRIIVPIEQDLALEKKTSELPSYLKGYVIEQQKLTPVQVKVDSIIIKGSKIMALHPKSDFIDGTLYIMAKAFFYRSEWLPSAIKCQELVEQFPESSYSPDAHLLWSKSLLITRNLPKSKIMISRTIDIAWQFEREDVLGEAFKLLAELSLELEDYEGAERPYRQAIVQANDSRQKAKWQNELGLLLFKMGKFKEAEKELAKVMLYNPDPVTEFEAKLYRGNALGRSGRYQEADSVFTAIDNNRIYDDYTKGGVLLAERIRIARLMGNADSLKALEKMADTTSGLTSSQAIIVTNFERGLELYRQKNYALARTYLGKSSTIRSPVFDGSNTLFKWLNTREEKLNSIKLLEQKIAGMPEKKLKVDTTTLVTIDTVSQQRASVNTDSIFNAQLAIMADSLNSLRSMAMFELGRVHEKMNNPDSAQYWFKQAMNTAPQADTSRAQYVFSYARLLQQTQPEFADSLYEHVFSTYKTTSYGIESRSILGFTELAVIDTAKELFRSGSQFRKIGDYKMALRQFDKLSETYPKHNDSPQALYTMGYIWEYNLRDNDSALVYYFKLISRYPSASVSNEIRYSFTQAMMHKRKNDTSFTKNTNILYGNLPDSVLQKMNATSQPKPSSVQQAPAKPQNFVAPDSKKLAPRDELDPDPRRRIQKSPFSSPDASNLKTLYPTPDIPLSPGPLPVEPMQPDTTSPKKP